MYVEVYATAWVPMEARRVSQVSVLEHRVPGDTPSLVWQIVFCKVGEHYLPSHVAFLPVSLTSSH